MKSPTSLIRPLVRRLHSYVPGEQPMIPGLIKLNTNENPYPPSPRVLEQVRKAVDRRLRLYPNPAAQLLRKRLARLHGCTAEQIFVGNGSDECLALAVRAFVEPCSGVRSARMSRRSVVQYFTPSYSLYPVLAETHGATAHGVPLEQDFGLPPLRELKRAGRWKVDAALSLVTTPNAPSGRGYRTTELDALCRMQRGVVLLDEAYAEFADQNALSLALNYPHVLVARTFSKAYSLCFLRVGYCVGHPALIAALDAIRDSYSVNGLGQIAAVATLSQLPYYRARFRQIIATRTMLTTALTSLGFEVLPSQANFILTRPPQPSAEVWLQELRERKVLVRWFSAPSVRDYLRITIGTDAEATALVKAATQILAARRSR
ncbi:MAG: histidinol-phosphate transaminase [Vicinamibacterales bacterium]